MSIETWQDLPKAQDDDETIEEAIARFIDAHNDDVTAHLAENQSLQSHRVNEIIDHLAASIIADKLKDFEVTVEKLTKNKQFFNIAFGNLDGWEVDSGGGAYAYDCSGVQLNTGSGIGNTMRLSPRGEITNLDFSAKNPVFEAVVRFSDVGGHISFFGIGELYYGFAGFKINNGALYIYLKNDVTSYESLISGITLTDNHTYRVVFESGVGATYYIDDVEVGSISQPIPYSDVGYIGDFFIQSLVSGTRRLNCTSLTIFQDK